MSGPPRPIDLSVARPIDRLGDISGSVGTDADMTPERCDPGRFDRLGPTADMRGLGVTLHEALTGAVPRGPASRHPGRARRRTPEPRPPLFGGGVVE